MKPTFFKSQAEFRARKSIDESRWTIRFTPRKPRSIWSAVNIKRVGELKALGLMKPSGLKQFEGRDEKRAKLYSFENAPMELDAALQKQFKGTRRPGSSPSPRPPITSVSPASGS